MELRHQEATLSLRVKHQLDAFWQNGNYGTAPKAKPANSIRIAVENFNSLGILTGMRKVNTINNLIRDFNVDVIAGSETQADWRYVSEGKQFSNLFGKGQEVRSVVAFNTTEDIGRDQMVGTAIAVVGCITSMVTDRTSDYRNLGWFFLLSPLPRQATTSKLLATITGQLGVS